MRRTVSLFAFTLAAVVSAGAQTQNPIDRITEADLKSDIFTMAGDAMRGREGGTLDEMAASVWVAQRAQDAGLLPAGDNGTYFQWFPLERFRVSASSSVSLGGKTLHMGKDVIPGNTVLADVDAPVVVVAADAVPGADITGKAVVVQYVPPSNAATQLPSMSNPNAAPALRTWLTGIQRAVASKNPAAIVAVVPDDQQDQWDRTAIAFPAARTASIPTAPPSSASPCAGCRCST